MSMCIGFGLLLNPSVNNCTSFCAENVTNKRIYRLLPVTRWSQWKYERQILGTLALMSCNFDSFHTLCVCVCLSMYFNYFSVADNTFSVIFPL